MSHYEERGPLFFNRQSSIVNRQLLGLAAGKLITVMWGCCSNSKNENGLQVTFSNFRFGYLGAFQRLFKSSTSDSAFFT
jgi:hypothetical protein